MSLSYICTNASCPAPAEFKGKEFPAAMDCIFCSTPLTAKTSFTSEQEDLLNSLPYLVAYPLKRTLLESHAWTKINLFKDTFLNYLKYLGLLCASEFFSSDLRNKNMVSLFQQALAEPSFGTWNMYIRESLKFLEDNNHQFFLAELQEYYARVETGKKRKLYKGNIEYIDGHGEVQLKKQEATGIGMLINFRNRFLGHGQTLDENESKALWEEYSPIFFTLLKQMSFCKEYPMLKNEHGNTYKLQTPEIKEVEHEEPLPSKVWIENASGDKIDVVPFFVVPGELAIAKEDKEQLLTYESYTGKTIKFFSPEGSEKQTSGNILERLNLLLREKQSENTFSPSSFTKEVFERQIREENKLLLNTLVAERKVIPGVYVHRKDIEVRLKEWVGARASILFITAEAGSGKTNLLVEAQRLYQEDGVHSVIIRAGRMEKVTLKEQLGYMLNLEPGRSLGDYEHIAGTQSAPTFVLLDGLNEASNAVSIWNEVLEVAGMFAPGSLKFVVTSRSNSNADIERYDLAEFQEELLYRDSKSENTDLKYSAFWLTALNMKEMKEAWLLYSKKDKSRFKPLFSFDDIADVDRGIYEQINNPLILRVFLEVYSGKKLLSKRKKVLNIWEDWLRTFSQEEKAFMQLMAAKVWEKGVNELLLDDLLKDKELKDYLVSDALNSPYQRLKNLGWMSRFAKDLDIVLGFTVEGLLLHLLAKQLEEKGGVDVHFIDDILDEGSTIKKSAIEQYLSLVASKGDISLVTALIDADGNYTSLCLKPLLNYIKVEGVESMVNEVLADPTDGDWEVLDELDSLLIHLALEHIRKKIAQNVSLRVSSQSEPAIKFRLQTICLLDNNDAQKAFEKISKEKLKVIESLSLLALIGDYFGNINELDEALAQFERACELLLRENKVNYFMLAQIRNRMGAINYKSRKLNEALKNFEMSEVSLELANNSKVHELEATILSNKGAVLSELGHYQNAIVCLEKAHHIRITFLGINHHETASSIHNIAGHYHRLGQADRALSYFKEALCIRIKTFGRIHPDIAISLNNLGSVSHEIGDADKALEYFNESYLIALKSLPTNDMLFSKIKYSVGVVNISLGKIDEGIKSFEESLDLAISNLGLEHSEVADIRFNLGCALIDGAFYNEAIEQLEMGYEYLPKGSFLIEIAKCYEFKKEHNLACEYFLKAAELWKSEYGLEDEDVLHAASNVYRLATSFKIDFVIPDWIFEEIQ